MAEAEKPVLYQMGENESQAVIAISPLLVVKSDFLANLWSLVTNPEVFPGIILEKLVALENIGQAELAAYDAELLLHEIFFLVEFSYAYPYALDIEEFNLFRTKSGPFPTDPVALLEYFFQLPPVALTREAHNRLKSLNILTGNSDGLKIAERVLTREADFQFPNLLAKRVGISLLRRQAENLYAAMTPADKSKLQAALEELNQASQTEGIRQIGQLNRAYIRLSQAGLHSAERSAIFSTKLMAKWDGNNNSTEQGLAKLISSFSQTSEIAEQLALFGDVELNLVWKDWNKNLSQVSQELANLKSDLENNIQAGSSNKPLKSPANIATQLRRALERNPLLEDVQLASLFLILEDVFALAFLNLDTPQGRLELLKILKFLLENLPSPAQVAALNRNWWANMLVKLATLEKNLLRKDVDFNQLSSRPDSPALGVLCLAYVNSGTDNIPSPLVQPLPAEPAGVKSSALTWAAEPSPAIKPKEAALVELESATLAGLASNHPEKTPAVQNSTNSTADFNYQTGGQNRPAVNSFEQSLSLGQFNRALVLAGSIDGDTISNRVYELRSQILNDLFFACEGLRKGFFPYTADLFKNIINRLQVLTEESGNLFSQKPSQKIKYIKDSQFLFGQIITELEKLDQKSKEAIAPFRIQPPPVIIAPGQINQELNPRLVNMMMSLSRFEIEKCISTLNCPVYSKEGQEALPVLKEGYLYNWLAEWSNAILPGMIKWPGAEPRFNFGNPIDLGLFFARIQHRLEESKNSSRRVYPEIFTTPVKFEALEYMLNTAILNWLASFRVGRS